MRIASGCLILVCVTFASAASAGSNFSKLEGGTFGVALNKYPVGIVAIDGKLRRGQGTEVAPGAHLLTLVSGYPTKRVAPEQVFVPFTVEPCKRYVLAAEHERPMREQWVLSVERVEDLAGCDPVAAVAAAAAEAAAKKDKARYYSFDFELTMLGDRVVARMVSERCGVVLGDEARAQAARARWEEHNGTAVDAIDTRLRYFTLSRGLLGRFAAAIDAVQRFEEAIAARRDGQLEAILGGAPEARCDAALKELEKRVAVYDRSNDARRALKDARSYNSKNREQMQPLVDKNWANLVEDAEVSQGYWSVPTAG